MTKNQKDHTRQTPTMYARIPAALFERFRAPGAPERQASDAPKDGLCHRVQQAPHARIRKLTLILKQNFAGAHLIDGSFMVMQDPPRPEAFLKADPEVIRKALLNLVIGGKADTSVWVRGRGFWVRQHVQMFHGTRASLLGQISRRWRECLHEIEMCADDLTRANDGPHQGFWQRELRPEESYRQKPEDT